MWDGKKLAAAEGWRNRALYGVIAMMLLISVTEYIFVYAHPAYGVALALFLALGVATATAVAPLHPQLARSLDSLNLVPLYILVTASLPWFLLEQPLLLPAVYYFILLLCARHLYARGATFASLKELGFHADNWPRHILLGLVAGIPLGITEYLVLTPAREAPMLEWINVARDTIYMFFFVGLGEELLFRAIIQRDLGDILGWKGGLVLSSILFGIMHMSWRSVPELFFTAFAGFVLGYVYYRTKGLLAPVAMHAMNNVLLVSILPYVFT